MEFEIESNYLARHKTRAKCFFRRSGLVAAFLFSLFFFSLSTPAYSVKTNLAIFEKIFTEWTQNFNHKNLNGSCDFFSQKVIADYQGFPQKSYATICNGFKKIFNENNRQYYYDFKIHHVYTFGNFAAIRITWYLTVYENNKVIEKTVDQGLDILEKNSQAKWKIIQYLGYPERYK